ncbi:hypothetical protein [Sphingobacterium sp. HMA12]|uniref:hypothetical protein n=1 Tax=Sphingobacterium sp. HMA12 TaxID=2050894 RepID=UPI000CEA238C|nr:hypothetical protein [Sphingobacterium sp. HMA12]
MYYFFLVCHSAIRWLVLGSLIYAIFTALSGLRLKKKFSPKTNAVRHWTATIAHIQLLIGMALYIQSPIVLANTNDALDSMTNPHVFFKYVHISLAVLAIVLITIGSAKAKRIQDDQAKYRTMLCWFTLALFLILIAIPWPFSPLSARPYLRSF